MIRIIFDKLLRLGRDEDGAALVVTLALLMFMYVACAGVFAIGQSVKDRVMLQNACDAAAYSAAVIQADTFSRIATINKAMSWTYMCLCRREMDYITYRWLEHTCKHYREDRDYWEEGEVIIDAFPVGSGRRVKLRNNMPWESRVERAVKEFPEKQLGHESFYAGKGVEIGILEKQILQDKQTISAMGRNIDDLVSKLTRRVQKVGRDILKVNLTQSSMCKYKVIVTDAERYFSVPRESQFLKYCEKMLSSDWYKLANEDQDPKGKGIWRKYSDDLLRAEWYWSVIDTTGKRRAALKCPHNCSYGWCRDETSLSYRHAWLTAGKLENHYKAYYTGQNLEDKKGARPRMLVKEYFGNSGTITIGLAKYNENPWARVFGTATAIAAEGTDKLGGIFAAFNPYRDVEWTWTFASAKAGYREKDQEYNNSREYRVDWDSNDDSWDLCVSDWDAVFVPVRSWNRQARDKVWEDEKSIGDDFMKKWIETNDWSDFPNSIANSTAPSYQVAAGSMPNLPGMHDNSGSIRDLNWAKMLDFLYH